MMVVVVTKAVGFFLAVAFAVLTRHRSCRSGTIFGIILQIFLYRFLIEYRLRKERFKRPNAGGTLGLDLQKGLLSLLFEPLQLLFGGRNAPFALITAFAGAHLRREEERMW